MNKVIHFQQKHEAGPWFDFRNITTESADLYFYGVIGDEYQGNDAASFIKKLQAVKSKNLNVHINSGGGYIVDGVGIYNALKSHVANVVTYIDGWALSIASVIALAGKRIVIAENGMMMIHNPSVGAMGDADFLRKQADSLDQIKETLITTYVERMGQPREVIASLMDDETWYTAQSAVGAKLADEIGSPVRVAASFDTSLYGYAKAPATNTSAQPPETSSPPARLKRRQALLEQLTK